MDFEGIYENYFERIYKYIFYMTSDAVLAEDLTQETFLRVYKGKFRNEAAMSTYIQRIARNLVYDSYRKKALIKWITFGREHEEIDNGKTPPEWIVASEERKELFEALQSLKPEHREVLIYRKIEELSIAETAALLNWSQVKVSNTLRSAMQSLKKQMGGEEDGFEQSIKGTE